MKIGVDARVLTQRPTGVARYLRGVLKHAGPSLRDDDQLTLFTDAPLAGDLPSGARVDVLRWPFSRADVLWRQGTLPFGVRKAMPDVLFCPFYSVPMTSRVRTVVTIHDIAFTTHPEWFDWRGKLTFRLVGPSARRAERVLTPSAFSANEIAREFHVPARKIDVTPLGVDPSWSVPPTESERRVLRDWLGFDEPFLLHLGAVHTRRLPEVIVDAFAHLALRFPDLHLVVAGPTIPPAPNLRGRARARRVDGRFARLRWVPEPHLKTLVAEAAAVVYLSLYEGFGLPALEAMAAGTPVVALRRASLPEVCGDAALWVEEPEADLVSSVLTELLEDPRARADRAAAGRARAALFTWPRTASLTWEAVRNAAKGGGSP